MTSRIDPALFVQSIKKLASKAGVSLPAGLPAHSEALARARRPVDYMRCAEFPLAFEHLSLKSGMKVLDISSPQWFSLYLATVFPGVHFYYVNILDSELDQIRDTAKCLGIKNVSYHKQDVRSLEFDAQHFDCAVSISVIEHVAPEIGGDVLALKEIKRVLVHNGELIMSVPLKDKPNVVYQNGAVYERAGKGRNFFAREYDFSQFRELINNSGFMIKKRSFIIEEPGALALDYWEWGPGKDKVYGNLIAKSIRVFERLMGSSIDDKLAVRYLKSSSEVQYRVVNIVATVIKNKTTVGG